MQLLPLSLSVNPVLKTHDFPRGELRSCESSFREPRSTDYHEPQFLRERCSLPSSIRHAAPRCARGLGDLRRGLTIRRSRTRRRGRGKKRETDRERERREDIGESGAVCGSRLRGVAWAYVCAYIPDCFSEVAIAYEVKVRLHDSRAT